MIEEIRNYLKSSALLKNGRIGVNYLSAKPLHYAVNPIPAEPVIRRYTDGSTLRQFVFTVSSRESFDAETAASLDISRFYEELAEAFEKLSEENKLPVFEKGSGVTPKRIEAMSTGYLIDSDETTARFQIQCRMIFRRERI